MHWIIPMIKAVVCNFSVAIVSSNKMAGWDAQTDQCFASTTLLFTYLIDNCTFSLYTDYRYKVLSDSSRGAGGNYTVSYATLNHTGVYVCEAERGKPGYKIRYSNKQLIWVTGEFKQNLNNVFMFNKENCNAHI